MLIFMCAVEAWGVSPPRSYFPQIIFEGVTSSKSRSLHSRRSSRYFLEICRPDLANNTSGPQEEGPQSIDWPVS